MNMGPFHPVQHKGEVMELTDHRYVCRPQLHRRFVYCSHIESQETAQKQSYTELPLLPYIETQGALPAMIATADWSLILVRSTVQQKTALSAVYTTWPGARSSSSRRVRLDLTEHLPSEWTVPL